MVWPRDCSGNTALLRNTINTLEILVPLQAVATGPGAPALDLKLVRPAPDVSQCRGKSMWGEETHIFITLHFSFFLLRDSEHFG